MGAVLSGRGELLEGAGDGLGLLEGEVGVAAADVSEFALSHGVCVEGHAAVGEAGDAVGLGHSVSGVQ